MEKDRFMKEYVNGDEWTVLSMLQAVTLYILLRIFDEDSFSTEFDRELTRAMTVRLWTSSRSSNRANASLLPGNCDAS